MTEDVGALAPALFCDDVRSEFGGAFGPLRFVLRLREEIAGRHLVHLLDQAGLLDGLRRVLE